MSWNGLHRQRVHRRDETDVKTVDYWHLADAIIALNTRFDTFEEAYKVAKGANDVLKSFQSIAHELELELQNLTPPTDLEPRISAVEQDIAKYKKEVGATAIKDTLANLVILNDEMQSEIQRIDSRWLTDVRSFQNDTRLELKKLRSLLESKIKQVANTVSQLRDLLEGEDAIQTE